jgi:acyl-lipid omega-6 desaturase (Delta-12 desaturase)
MNTISSLVNNEPVVTPAVAIPSTAEAARASDTAQQQEDALYRAVAPFKRSDPRKSLWQAANTIVPLGCVWALMYVSLSWSYLLTLALAIPAAGLLVRLFIIQHDCGHQSFFPSRRANDLLGAFCSVFTLTPYRLWRRSHSRHHASSGNLNHRGHGDVWVMTVDEFQNASPLDRLKYRAYRHPLFLFVIGPSLHFILRNRFTVGLPSNWRRERRSVHGTNIALAGMVLVACWTIGPAAFFSVHLPVVALAASIGSWLFFVQHQYEQAYWEPDDRWDFLRSSLEGSSYYRLPRVLQWFTGNIGFHHIHHFDSRIPNYHLAACLTAVPQFHRVVTLGFWESMKCHRFKLWDEHRRQMVTFREARHG